MGLATWTCGWRTRCWTARGRPAPRARRARRTAPPQACRAPRQGRLLLACTLPRTTAPAAAWPTHASVMLSATCALLMLQPARPRPQLAARHQTSFLAERASDVLATSARTPRRPAWCVLNACRPPRRCSRGRRGARARERGGQQRAGGRGARRAGERRRRGARRGGRARGRRRRRGARRRGQARLPGRRGGAEAVRVRAEHPRAPQPAVAPGRRQPVLQPCALSPLAHARSWRPGAHARPGAPCSAALTGSFGPLRRSLPPAAASGQTRQPAVTQTSRFRV